MNSEAKVIGKGRCDTDVQVLNMQRMAMVFNTAWGGAHTVHYHQHHHTNFVTVSLGYATLAILVMQNMIAVY